MVVVDVTLFTSVKLYHRWMSHLEIHCNLACFLDFQILNIFHHTIVNATYIHSYLGTLT